MPKQKITRDMVLGAAFELARERGLECVTVHDIAGRLGCSVQPIYSYCRSMDCLRAEVCLMSGDFVREYVAVRADPADLFRSTGRAYLLLAQEERHVLRMFLARRRENRSGLDALCRAESDPRMSAAIAAQLGLSEENARALHLNMLIYTLGLCVICASAEPAPIDELRAEQNRAFDAFLAEARRKEKNNEK